MHGSSRSRRRSPVNPRQRQRRAWLRRVEIGGWRARAVSHVWVDFELGVEEPRGLVGGRGLLQLGHSLRKVEARGNSNPTLNWVNPSP